jgi:hypothetical protein
MSEAAFDTDELEDAKEELKEDRSLIGRYLTAAAFLNSMKAPGLYGIGLGLAALGEALENSLKHLDITVR